MDAPQLLLHIDKAVGVLSERIKSLPTLSDRYREDLTAAQFLVLVDIELSNMKEYADRGKLLLQAKQDLIDHELAKYELPKKVCATLGEISAFFVQSERELDELSTQLRVGNYSRLKTKPDQQKNVGISRLNLGQIAAPAPVAAVPIAEVPSIVVAASTTTAPISTSSRVPILPHFDDSYLEQHRPKYSSDIAKALEAEKEDMLLRSAARQRIVKPTIKPRTDDNPLFRGIDLGALEENSQPPNQRKQIFFEPVSGRGVHRSPSPVPIPRVSGGTCMLSSAASSIDSPTSARPRWAMVAEDLNEPIAQPNFDETSFFDDHDQAFVVTEDESFNPVQTVPGIRRELVLPPLSIPKPVYSNETSRQLMAELEKENAGRARPNVKTEIEERPKEQAILQRPTYTSEIGRRYNME